MLQTIAEQRKYQRRNIQFSVLLSPVSTWGGNSKNFCIGNIIDVGLGGVCIQTHSSHAITTGGKVLMLASTGETERNSGSDVPVEIKGVVVWKKGEENLLGIRYL